MIEILVAMAILSVLGLALMLILRGGLATWKRSEAKRESYDQAEAIFLQLREDMLAINPPFDTPLDGTPVESRLLCDLRHPENQTATSAAEAGVAQRLILVRSIKAESEHPITGHAGSQIGAQGVIDFRDDLAEARVGQLRATGGQMEVAWVLSPAGVLYRGARAPIGPPGSLFDDGSYELAPPPLTESNVAPVKAPEAPDGQQPPPAPVGPQPAVLRPFATDVIHFGLRFWSQYSRGWSAEQPPKWQLSTGEESGSLHVWDSTRSLQLDDRGPASGTRGRGPRKVGPYEFTTFLRATSLDDPRDDIIPSKIRVELVLRQDPIAGSATFLLDDIKANATEIPVQDPERILATGGESGFVYIGGEWIEYEEIDGDTLRVKQRGARFTVAADHTSEQIVHAGKTFVTILEVPGHREDWGDLARRRRRQ